MSWMQTKTGRHIDSAKPEEVRYEDIDIRDIAWSLSLLCRYNGHCDRFYSVAEHCCRLFDVIPGELWEEVAPAILLHDAAETYLSDIPRPLKTQEPMQFYRELEKRWLERIYERFGIELTDRAWSIIHTLDSYILCFEGPALLNAVAADWEVMSMKDDLETKLNQLGLQAGKVAMSLGEISGRDIEMPGFWYHAFLDRFRRLEL